MRRRLGVLGVVIALAVVGLVGAPAADAQAGPADPAATVLAIVSPVVSPVCSLSGSATLLVPIVSGLVGSSLPAEIPSVGDLILDSLGPVFVVCGSLPAPPGTRCQVDDQISGILPAEISSVTGPLPAIVGNVLDALNATLAGLGIPPQDALGKALVCDVNTGPGVTEAPPGSSEVVPPGGAVDGPLFIAPSETPSLPTGSPPTAPEPTSPRSRPRPQPVVAIDSLVSGGLHALQLTVIAAMALVLALGWTGTWRDARRAAREDR